LSGRLTDVKAERMVAALLMLQARGRVTAVELAEELEVSVKTARRDLEALGLAGFPVYSQPGRHGGWHLLGGGRTDLSGLTASEARALFSVAGPAVTATPEVRAALRKLVRALPESFRVEAQAAADSVVIDDRAWGQTTVAPPKFVSVLQQAVIESRRVRLAYRDRARSETERLIDPFGLVAKGGRWYLVGGTDHGMRSFRVDRVHSIEVLDEAAPKPEGFDLLATWEAIVGRVEDLRRPVRSDLRTTRPIAQLLSTQFGADVEFGAELADGRIEVQMFGAEPLWIAERLAGWGRLIEVVGPVEVRLELLRLARELLVLHEEVEARLVEPPAISR